VSRVKSKQMAESKKPRGRNGGRIPLPPEKKRVLAYFYIPRWLLEAFKALIPVAVDRSNLISIWVQAYIAANSRSDNLLVQSALATELLTYLETTNAPKHLSDRLKYLIVQQRLKEREFADEVAKKKNGA
jgi:hypothetical protein